MKYFIGIDVGGTKTAFVCRDENNNLIGEYELGSCHILQVSETKSIQILQSGVNYLSNKINDNDKQIFICAGLAGYGKNIDFRNKIENICKQSFEKYNYIIRSDADIALYGALNGNDGILVICGTGSIALSLNKGKLTRCGGWGYMLGDEASAYYMAKQLLNVFTKQCDGRINETILKKYIKDKLNLNDDYDIIAYISNNLENKRDKIAKLAILVYELALLNEPNALSIYENSAKEIAYMINTLAKDFDNKVFASYAGGVWNAKDILINKVKKYLSDKIIFEAPKNKPSEGACILAKKYFSNN